MSVFPGSSNAVVYAQFNLQGRWKRLLIIAGGYGLLIAGAIWLTTFNTANYRSRDLEGWVGALTALQVINLLVFGAFRVEWAVRGDVSSRMIESHRLMPAPPLGSILGYIFGAPLQAILMAAVNFALGTACCAICGLSLGTWALLNGMLLFFSICVYAVIAQFSFLARGGFLILLIGGGLALSFTASGGLQMLPSLDVLLFPMLSQYSVFVLMFNSSRMSYAEISLVYPIALLGQAVIAALAVRVGIRRYLSASAIGLTSRLGLLLLVAWVALAMAQFDAPAIFNFRRFSTSEYGEQDLVARTVCALATSMLLALFPIASAARAAWLFNHVGDHSSAKKRWSLGPVLSTVIVAAVIICLLLIDEPAKLAETKATLNSLMTPVIIANFLAAVGCIFSWGYMLRRRAWIYVSLWVVLTWLGPIIADSAYRALTDANSSDPTAITAFSPPGALALIWSRSQVRLLPGIIGQMILTIIPVGIFLLTRHISSSRAAGRSIVLQLQH